MGAPNVTAEENELYKDHTAVERQLQYGKKIVKNNPAVTIKELKGSLAWKFGACLLRRETLAEMVK